MWEWNKIHDNAKAADGRQKNQPWIGEGLTAWIPILAGPGTIAAAMSCASGGVLAEVIISIAAFAVLCLVTYAQLN